MPDEIALNPVELATELTIAWLGNQNNRISAEEVPQFLRTMHQTVTELASGTSTTETSSDERTQEESFTPAVTARKSLASRDHIISMIDGKPYKSLKRHLSRHGLTPDQYRQRYGLKTDYPMVAPSYSEVRRDMAKKIGLGSKGRAAKAAGAGSAEAAAKRGRGRAKQA
ncbi:MAG TPA: MucR family transcriptional regulator [Allosphingosinicella sp.]|jgi:predicted transcriptional regulator|nr:MucR family transcriptional regulator [Allosphingosinicella sp.]